MLTILSTKLYIPPARTNAVARPRLYQKLLDGLARPLTLISAPAGFGKSTLVSEWYQQSQNAFPLAWVSLDTEDNDPERFLAYLAAAFGKIQAGLGERLLDTLNAPQSLSPRAALGLLLRDLAEFSGTGVLVLDDYHTITNAEIHDLVSYLIGNLPLGLHLIIATRADPPLPLARLRVNDRLVEIRAADLLFRSEEAEAFLAETMGLSLSKSAANRLTERTEGWAAGLQLAALAARAEGSREHNLDLDADFGGEHPFLLDYLLEEVLARLPADRQRFLLFTALLDELCGSLCDAVLESQGSALLLDMLYRANLFLIPLGPDADGRQWFRYHHLFADGLRARLRQLDQAVMPELLGRAARWYAGQERMDEAIRYALQANDQSLAAQWIETTAHNYLKNGRVVPVRDWLRQIDENRLRSRPGLALIWARSLYMTGDFARCGTLLDELEQRGLSEAAGDTPGHLGEVYTLRASIHSIHADWTAAIADAQRALATLPGTDHHWRAMAALNLGNASMLVGDLPAADAAFTQVVHEGLLAGNLNAVFNALTNQAELLVLRGQLRASEERLQQGLQIIQDISASGRSPARIELVPTASLVYCRLAERSIEQRDLAAAERWIEQALELAQPGGYIVVVTSALSTRAHLELARGLPEKGLAWVEQAIGMVKGPQASGLLSPLFSLQARLRLQIGDLPAVQRWAEEVPQEVASGYFNEVNELVLLRLYRAQGQTERGLALAQCMLSAAEAGGRLFSVLQIHLQMALLLQQAGDHAGALQALREALALGFPRGFRNLFLDAGEELRPLLQSFMRGCARECALDDPLREAARQILGLFAPDEHQVQLAPNQQLVEPLSERELDVLRMLAEGASNQAIADRLILSLGTVKSHVHHIQGKLGTRSRVELVQRAKALGLV